MQIFTDQFITFMTYCAPGICAVVPYWKLWRVKRMGDDHLMTLISSILLFRGLQQVASWILMFVFGSSLFLGDWGDSCANWTMSFIGLAAGLYAGIRFRRMGRGAKCLYPWFPFPYR